jgi:CO/xanthine dehydrogenase Mo-binding subunit
MSVFSKPVFEGTVVFDGKELFKGQGSARQWAQKVEDELGIPVEAVKIGTGWALAGAVDGVDTLWGIYGQRLKRISDSPDES